MIKVLKIFTLLAIVVLLVVSCNKTKTYTVEYKLTGSIPQGYQVTYFNEAGNVKQDTGVASGWNYSFSADESFFAYVSGFTSHDSSDISVTILDDGNQFESASETGYEVTATAEGFIP